MRSFKAGGLYIQVVFKAALTVFTNISIHMTEYNIAKLHILWLYWMYLTVNSIFYICIL